MATYSLFRQYRGKDLKVGEVIAVPSGMQTVQIDICGKRDLGGMAENNGDMESWVFDHTVLNAAILDFAPDESVNYSVTTTLDRTAYIYVVGDKPGKFKLSGTAFGFSCRGPAKWRNKFYGINGGDANAGQSPEMTDDQRPEGYIDEHGISRIMSIYRDLRLTLNSGYTYLTFSPGNTVAGLLVGWNGRVNDPSTDAFNFTLDFVMLPGVISARKKAR